MTEEKTPVVLKVGVCGTGGTHAEKAAMFSRVMTEARILESEFLKKAINFDEIEKLSQSHRFFGHEIGNSKICDYSKQLYILQLAVEFTLDNWNNPKIQELKKKSDSKGERLIQNVMDFVLDDIENNLDMSIKQTFEDSL